ncbi:MAG: hypothetical protein Q7S26_03215 [bacterium]|nr:hypothetical protein [bacterium]
MAETRSQIWALAMREIAQLELHLTLTIGEYFARCDTPDPHQWILVRQYRDKPLHDFMIEVERGQIPPTEFFHLATIKRQGSNHLLIWAGLYHIAMHDDQE